MGSKKENTEANRKKSENNKEDLKSMFLKYGYGPILLCDSRFVKIANGNKKGTGRTLSKKNDETRWGYGDKEQFINNEIIMG